MSDGIAQRPPACGKRQAQTITHWSCSRTRRARGTTARRNRSRPIGVVTIRRGRSSRIAGQSAPAAASSCGSQKQVPPASATHRDAQERVRHLGVDQPQEVPPGIGGPRPVKEDRGAHGVMKPGIEPPGDELILAPGGRRSRYDRHRTPSLLARLHRLDLERSAELPFRSHEEPLVRSSTLTRCPENWRQRDIEAAQARGDRLLKEGIETMLVRRRARWCPSTRQNMSQSCLSMWIHAQGDPLHGKQPPTSIQHVLWRKLGY